MTIKTQSITKGIINLKLIIWDYLYGTKNNIKKETLYL